MVEIILALALDAGPDICMTLFFDALLGAFSLRVAYMVVDLTWTWVVAGYCGRCGFGNTFKLVYLDASLRERLS